MQLKRSIYFTSAFLFFILSSGRNADSQGFLKASGKTDRKWKRGKCSAPRYWSWRLDAAGTLYVPAL